MSARQQRPPAPLEARGGRDLPRLRIVRAAAAACVPVALAAAAAGCGGSGAKPADLPTRTQIQGYLRQVEPPRLAVNRLLEGADPILAAWHGHRIAAREAGRRMDRLERRFAALAVDVAAIEPPAGRLAGLHAAYAGTYVEEDAYLSALATGIAEGSVSDLPDTQAQQRAQIIRWRVGLEALARSERLALPADLAVAGRGEIAPSALGGS